MEARYYTPAMHETQPDNPGNVSIGVATVVNTCFKKAFIDRPNKNGSRLQLFTDGQPPFFPSGSEKEIFLAEAAGVAEFYVRDLLDGEGSVLPEKNEEFRNVLEVGSELVKIFTDDQSYLSLTQQSQTLNILGAALYIARNPQSAIEISVGIGGSDSDMTSARFAAYGIPGARIAEKMSAFFDKRIAEKAAGETCDKILEAEFPEGPSDGDIKSQKKARKKEIFQAISEGNINIGDHLSDEEIEALHNRYAIPRNKPKFRVFFAHEAAKAINHSMDPEKIPQRTDENMKAMAEYMERFHPTAASLLELSVDKPWCEHTRYQGALVKYLAHELRMSDDPVVQKTLGVLRKLGQNHGGDMGAELAAEYAAIHPIVFGDRIDLPTSPFVVGQKKDPDIRIVIGGKTEREFCAVREYLTKTANADRMIAFLEKGACDDKNDSSSELLPALRRWKNIADETRRRYKDTGHPRFMRTDLPVHTVQLITSIGASPTYYPTEHDIPAGSPIDTILSHATKLDRLNEELKQDGFAGDRAQLKNVRTDYEALAQDMIASGVLEQGEEVVL